MPTSLYSRKLVSKDDKTKVRKYTISKADADFEFQGSYTIMHTPMDDWVCNCPAYMQNCRHVRMMEVFDRADAGEDPIFNALAMDGKYAVFLRSDGKRVEWVQGPQIGE